MKYLSLFFFCAMLACQAPVEESSPIAIQVEFAEKHRPQFHFSPPSQWMNDPNGMVYYDGEYHLFYQHYPDSNVWGPMHWGHAVSKDLIEWDHLPIALYPDSLGYIFSGSAVVDWNNSSGLGENGEPPLVAIYTYHDAVRAETGDEDFQYQGIAFSNDKGRSWTKYTENPVLPNSGDIDFRDPKVIWHEPTSRWIMVLAVKDHIDFYSSSDLINWKFESDFGSDMGSHGGVWECPDLFELPIEGTDSSAWVLLVSIGSGGPNGGSATQYFTGGFDGKSFDAHEQPGEEKWIDWGTDNYAGVTWSDIPENDGRRLFIGWMSNWQYAQIVPTETWRSAMTIPREMGLVNFNDGLTLRSNPVREVDNYRSSQASSTAIDSLSDISFTLEWGDSPEAEVIFGNDNGETFTILLNRATSQVIVSRKNSGDTSFHPKFGNDHRAPYVFGPNTNVRILLDVGSSEVFIDEGRLVMTELFFPSAPFNSVSVTPEPVDMASYSLKSIWVNDEIGG